MSEASAVTTETPGTTGAPGATGTAQQPAQGARGPSAAPPPGGLGRDERGRFQGQQAEQVHTPEPRRIRVKSKSGGEEEIPLTEEYIQRAASFEREGHHRLRQIAEERKALEAERAALQKEREEADRLWSDPVALRKHLRTKVTDPDLAHKIGVQLVRLDLDEQNADPRDLKLREYEERERERQQQEEEQAKQRAEQELRERAEALRPRFVQTLSGVLEQGGLPKTPAMLGRAAEMFKDNHVHGWGLDEKGMAQALKQDIDEELDARMSDPALDDAAFRAAYPKVFERAKAILIAEARERKGRAQGTGPHQTSGPAVRPPEQRLAPDGSLPPRRVMTREEREKTFGTGMVIT